MKVAVTYENGNVYQHFGHCAQFKISLEYSANLQCAGHDSLDGTHSCGGCSGGCGGGC